jgi:hypothetical protein
MRTIIWIFSLSLLLIAGFFVTAFDLSSTSEISESEAEVRELIEKSYINGAFNDLDPEAMKQGFHEDFAIYSPDGEQMAKYPIDRWVESVRKRKSTPDFDPAANRWDHEFVSVDVTGHSAAAKINLFREGEHVYTDYLSMLKFDSGWKIVAKVYYQHQ